MAKAAILILAQLANPIDNDRMLRKLDLDRYFAPLWWWEQKLDGDRLMLQIEDGEVIATNRNGEPSKHSLKGISEHLFDFNGSWVLDGEYIDGVFYVFDMPLALTRIDTDTPYELRRAGLEAIYAKIADRTNRIQLVPTAKTVDEKAELLRWCATNNAEGIMVKDISSPYYAGLRSSRTLKLKFWESCDAVITELWREGKRSIGVEVYDTETGEPIDIGSVTMTERNLAKVCVGDVVEIKYLYVGSNNRLYQPSFLRVRLDKEPDECNTSQLKYVSKIVRTDRKER